MPDGDVGDAGHAVADAVDNVENRIDQGDFRPEGRQHRGGDCILVDS